MPKLPRAILFDLDDTIISAFGNVLATWQRAAEEFAGALAPLEPGDLAASIERQSRLLWSDAAWNKEWRVRIADARRLIVASAFAEFVAAGRLFLGPELGQMIADRFTAVREEGLSIFPGAHETLDRLKRLGVRLALVTNGAAEPQRAKVVRFALEERFDHIQIEGEHGFGKPEERTYRHALEALGAEPRQTWMVGDNLEWEIAAPQRLGIYGIWYDGYALGLPSDCDIHPDRIIQSLPELLA
jgi:putative hydrolase of the HAD superfamily